MKREAEPVGGQRRKPFGGVRRRPNLGRDRVRQAQRRTRDGSSKRGKREAEPVGGQRRKPFGGVRRRPNLGRDRVRQAQRNRDGSSKRGKREVDSVESSLGMLLPVPVESFPKAPLVKREADPVGGHRRKPFGGVRRRPNLGRDRVRQAQRRNRAKRSPERRGEGGRGRYPKRGIRSNNKSNIFARKKLLNNRG